MSLSYDFVNISLCGVRKTWITILLIIVGLALGVQCITPSISPPQKRGMLSKKKENVFFVHNLSHSIFFSFIVVVDGIKKLFFLFYFLMHTKVF